MTAYGHSAGEFIECLSIAIQLRKEETVDQFGKWRIESGIQNRERIDQDSLPVPPIQNPDRSFIGLLHGTLQGIYITHIDEDSPAARAGLRRHDKILQVNGLDFTLLTHERAVKYIKKYAVLDMLVARAELPPLHH
ncbi:PDZ/DHR/GLGF domain protein [Ostertagia ostertagi]